MRPTWYVGADVMVTVARADLMVWVACSRAERLLDEATT
jgi:hypothetical protein